MELPRLVVPGPDTGLVGRLRTVAGALGDRIALASPDGTLTFADLVGRIDALAAELAPLLPPDPAGGRPWPQPVGLYADQSPDSVAAMLAVIAAGRPCVVLDVLMPAARLADVVRQAGVTVVLADDDHAGPAAALPGVTAVRGLRPAERPAHGAPAGGPPGEGPAATVVFTSGSTGTPKGVVQRQQGFLAAGLHGRVSLGLGPADRVAFVLPQAFLAGQELLFMALLNGAALYVRDPRVHGARAVVDWLLATRVTTLHCTPSLLRGLLAALPAGSTFDSVRLVTTCGEKVYGSDVAAARPLVHPDAVVLNWLGSSETLTLTTFAVHPGDPVPDGLVPAGWPVPLREFEVIGDDGHPVAPGGTGVLHVVSAHLSGGYWESPGETAARFEPLPDGRVRYRTGDRVRIDGSGALHVVGRVDDAVKIRGYLVDPSEVEAALRRTAGVQDAVVRAVRTAPDVRGDATRLVAWVVPQPGTRPPSPVELRARLSRSLPDWMVPRECVLLPALPRNERGKLDVAALPEPPARPDPRPPVTSTQRRLAAIWAPMLRLDAVGRDESFTALGGDSLAVEEMLAAVRDEFGAWVPTADLAEHPTVEQFAELLDGRHRTGSDRRSPDLVRLRTDGDGPPVFCIAGAGGEAAFFEPFAVELGPDHPVYALQAHALEGRGLPDWTVNRAARRHVREIEEIAPTGPIALVGHSLGGLIALRAARILQAGGREVSLVALLDTFLPPAVRPAGNEEMGPASEPAPAGEIWRTRLQLPLAGLWAFDRPQRLEVFHQLGARVARFHRPLPWHGRALVFLSAENTDEVDWWRALFPLGPEVHRLPTDHNGLLRLPYVGEVAEQVRTALAATEPATASR